MTGKEVAIRNVEKLLSKNMEVITSSIPKHMTAERMLRVAVTTIGNTPGLSECSDWSLVAAVVEASQLGLEIDGRGQAYLVPFKTKQGGKIATLIIGYKGKIELAYRSGKVKNIYAEIICQHDLFNYEMGLHPKIEHMPAWEKERGPMIGVYAVAELMTGGKPFVVLSRKEVMKVKASSQGSDSPYSPWKKWEEEMWKKTAIHRLSKMIPSSPEMQRAVALEDQARGGVIQTLAPDVHLLGVDAPSPQSASDDNLKQLKGKITPPPDETPENEPPDPEEPPVDKNEPSKENPEAEKGQKYTITGEQKGRISELCEERSMTIKEAMERFTSKTAIGRLQTEEADELIKKLEDGGSEEPAPEETPETESVFPEGENTMPDASVPPWPDWSLEWFKKENMIPKNVKAVLVENFGIIDNQEIYDSINAAKEDEEAKTSLVTMYVKWEEEQKAQG